MSQVAWSIPPKAVPSNKVHHHYLILALRIQQQTHRQRHTQIADLQIRTRKHADIYTPACTKEIDKESVSPAHSNKLAYTHAHIILVTLSPPNPPQAKFTHMHTNALTHTHIHTHAHTHTRTHAHTNTQMQQNTHKFTHMHTYMQTCT